MRKALKLLDYRKQKHLSRWKNIINRCYNKNSPVFKYYGGRGIVVCREWRVFKNFSEWCERTYVEGMTLDRKNNSLGYSPKNCRWATKTQQARNSRVTKLKVLKSCENLKIAREKTRKIFGNPVSRIYKICSKCRVKKSLKNFHKSSFTKDFVQPYCIECRKLMDRKRFLTR